MRRFERLGNFTFITTILSLSFHTIAISYNDWLLTTCRTCEKDDPLASWKISFNYRCYVSPIGSIFLTKTNLNSTFLSNPYKCEVCISNKYLFPKSIAYAKECLEIALSYSDTICETRNYNENHCHCDYPNRTKILSSATILVEIILVLVVLQTHCITFLTIDFIVRWLIIICFCFLLLTIICLLIILLLHIIYKLDDLKELRYSWSLIEQSFGHENMIDHWKNELIREINTKYNVKFGWCFGMEFLSFYFALISLLLCVLMSLVKQRVEI